MTKKELELRLISLEARVKKLEDSLSRPIPPNDTITVTVDPDHFNGTSTTLNNYPKVFQTYTYSQT